MKTLAFVMGLLSALVGAVGVLVPSELIWLSRQALTSWAFYGMAGVRVAAGLVFVAAAPSSREPRAVRLLGYYALLKGVATAAMGLLALGRARAAAEWWWGHGDMAGRLTGAFVLALGGFVAFACAPSRRGT